MNPKLKAITETAAVDLVALVADKEQEILDAWHACAEEAQLQETKPKFRLSLAITLDLDANSMETALTFAIRRKVSVSHEIPDLEQIKLAV